MKNVKWGRAVLWIVLGTAIAFLIANGFMMVVMVVRGIQYRGAPPREEQIAFVVGPVYNGVAILSRLPIGATRKGFGDKKWDEQKRIISAQLKKNELHILNIYAPHGGLPGEDKHRYKKEWYEQLISHLDAFYSPKDPLLILGDFNVARADLDVFDPEELEVRFENEHVIVDGRVAPRHEGREHIYGEYGIGDFFREFRVNEAVDASRISAELKDGVLTLHLPKAEAIKPKRIEVKSE